MVISICSIGFGLHLSRGLMGDRIDGYGDYSRIGSGFDVLVESSALKLCRPF